MEYRRVTPKNVVHIPVGEAASNFASLLGRVHRESTEFIIEEQGQPVAVLSPSSRSIRPRKNNLSARRSCNRSGKTALSITRTISF